MDKLCSYARDLANKNIRKLNKNMSQIPTHSKHYNPKISADTEAIKEVIKEI